METATAAPFLDAFRASGLWTEDQLAAAEGVAAEAGDLLTLADRLWPLGCLTKYQYVKVRNGRLDDLLYGPYLVLDKVGEGGMGKVFKAVDTAHARTVALKTIRPQLASNKTVVKRYEREAKAALALKHPNVVTMYDAAEVSPGRFVMAMEFVEGVDLSRLVKEYGRPPEVGMPDPAEVCEYVRQAALGLHAAHVLGFVHRDIKPSNILVSGERALSGSNGAATVKILDMGLVRQVLESDDSTKTELTRDGTVVGTPDYMAPEQAKNSSTVDHRADLYALGCTLYFLLKGQAPFPEGSPLDKLIRHQLDAPPDLRPLRPDVPEAVHRVMERLLRKKPQERFDSAADVAAALAPYTPGGAAGNAAEPAPQLFLDVSLAPDPPADPTPHGGPADPPGPAAGPPSGATPKATKKKLVLRPVSPPPTATVAHPTPASGTTRRLVPAQPPLSGAIKRAAAGGPVTPVTDPASGSISGPLTGKISRAATPVSTPAHRPKTPPATRRPARRGKSREMNPLLYAAGGFGLIALALLGYLALRPSDKRTVTTQPTGPEAPPTEVSRYAYLPPPAQTFAPGTVAALVVYPQPLWEAAKGAAPPAVKAQLDGLAKRARFDARPLDRVSVSFTAKAGSYVAVGEWPGLTADWEADAAARLELNPEAVPGGKLFRLDPKADPAVTAAIPKYGYAASNDPAALTGLLKWFGEKPDRQKLPAGVSRVLAKAFPVPADNSPPVAAFAATGMWSLPGGKALDADGIKFVSAEARWADGKFALTLALTGPDETRVKEFVSEELADLALRHRPLGTIIGQLTDNRRPAVEPAADGGVTVRYAKTFEWNAVSLAAEQLMPEPPKK